MLDVTGWTADDLRGSRLREVVKHSMAAGSDGYEAGYDEAVVDTVLDNFATSFGWRPPRELGMYVAAEAALAAFAATQEDFWLDELGGWMFSIALDEGELEPLDDPLALLTGLVQFGMDASGDTCFVSVLPHPDEIAEVWVYDHEVGEISHHLGYSITDAVLSAYLDEDDDPTHFQLAESELGDKWERGRPDFLRADALHVRANWLVGLLWGDPGYAFERRLGEAPEFATWIEEKSAATEYPHLAAYWALSHYFFGNADACAEALEILGKHGDGMSALATTVERALKHNRPIGDLATEQLAEFRELVGKNAVPEQLAPSAESPKKARKAVDIDAALADGATELELIEQHPDDVALHDELLGRIGASDPDFQKLVDQYLRERAKEQNNRWPYGDKPLDARLSIPLSAAFRAGLRYGASHKKANAGITRTLQKFDDDYTIAACRAAIESLKPDDARLPYVIERLTSSAHPEAFAVLVLGAHRFLDNLEGLAVAKAAREKEWPSLDDLFRQDDYFVRALLDIMRPSRDLSELQAQTVKALARKILQNTSSLAALGVAWARAMQIVAKYEMDDVVYLAAGYLEAFRDTIDHQTAEFLRDEIVLNLTESARTLALRDPERAAQLLRALFEADYRAPAYRADVIGSLLAGLLLIEPDAEDVLGWTERILGSRSESRPIRLYGALRGLETRGNERARDWIWPHVYSGFSGITAWRSTVGMAAVRALSTLGVDEGEIPAFDDSDWYARKLSSEAELLAALDAPNLYGAKDVWKRLREGEHRSDAVAKRAGDWLVDSLRFAEDDHDRGSHGDRFEAIRVLRMQGSAAVDQFERLFELEHIGGEWLGYAVPFTRYTDVAGAMMTWLHDVSDAHLCEALETRAPRWLPFLDHLAAEALVRGLNIADALREANEWRASFQYDYTVREDLLANRLPRLFVMAGGDQAFCSAQLEAANSITEDYWKQALETTSTPEPVALLEGDGALDLDATGEAWYEPKLRNRVVLDGSTVTVVISVTGHHARGVLGDGAWSGTYKQAFDDADAALEYANQLLRRLAVLGYSLSD